MACMPSTQDNAQHTVDAQQKLTPFKIFFKLSCNPKVDVEINLVGCKLAFKNRE